MESKLYSSTELLNAVGCTRKTLRVFQDKGLIQPVKRSGHRRYSADSFVRLRFILALRELGFSFDELTVLFERGKNNNGDAGQVANVLVKDVDVILDALDQRMATLEHTRRMVLDARLTLTDCSSCEKPLDDCQTCASTGRLDPTSRVLLAGRGAGIAPSGEQAENPSGTA